MRLWDRLPEWLVVTPAVVLWAAALVDVVRDRTTPTDARLAWGLFLVLLPPLAPVRFILRRKVVDPRPTGIDPPRESYIERVEALGRVGAREGKEDAT